MVKKKPRKSRAIKNNVALPDVLSPTEKEKFEVEVEECALLTDASIMTTAPSDDGESQQKMG